MRVPVSWLREYVPVEATADELAERLSVGGLAVEEIIRSGEGVAGVVVGRVLEVSDIPGKRVVMVKADTGDGPIEIVCGARNFSAGDLVPVAKIGATLPGLEIGRREVLPGVWSNGMLCSARELGVSEDHTGILVLDGDVKIGQDVREALGLDDVILDLDVMPNRPDCLSVYGVAREVAAIYGLPLRPPPAPLPPQGGSPVRVRVDDRAGCPRYSATVTIGVEAAAQTPWWMRRRLMAAGMRPISAIVDVTNYVLLELGQPLHAFDLAKLEGPEIVVRKPRKTETEITTLDGVHRALDRDDVLICDASKPVALAGIMGGAYSEVSTGTRDVLLESATFDPVRILRTARRLGLRTEASIRFERGTDPEVVPVAAARAASLMAEITGGAIGTTADVYPKPFKAKPITLQVARAETLVGTTITADEMSAILRALGCDVTAKGRASLRVAPPSWRRDLSIEEDLVEEVSRIYGYDRVPATLPAGGRVGGLTEAQRLRRVARRALLGAGLSEAQTLSLISPELPDVLMLPASHPWRDTLRVSNPLSVEESTLRRSLVPGLLSAAKRNVSRHVQSVALFEIGTVFAPSGGELADESLEVAWVMTGPTPGGWHGSQEFDFFDAKGVLESLASALGVRTLTVSPGDAGPPYHPARQAIVGAGGVVVGEIAELAPKVASAFDLTHRVAIGRCDLGALLAAAQTAVALPLPKLPPVTRDLALVVPATVTAAEVDGVIRSAGGELLDAVQLFDVYRGSQTGEDRVSLAWSLTFRHPERTLTDAEVDEAMTAITTAATGRGWTVRQ